MERRLRRHHRRPWWTVSYRQRTDLLKCDPRVHMIIGMRNGGMNPFGFAWMEQ